MCGVHSQFRVVLVLLNFRKVQKQDHRNRDPYSYRLSQREREESKNASFVLRPGCLAPASPGRWSLGSESDAQASTSFNCLPAGCGTWMRPSILSSQVSRLWKHAHNSVPIFWLIWLSFFPAGYSPSHPQQPQTVRVAQNDSLQKLPRSRPQNQTCCPNG